jgi:uncharacterized protein YdhG (YjbR/CyaY superfamily)
MFAKPIAMNNPAAPKNIDEYIACFPEDIQALLKQIRATVKEAAPGAEETIKYAMPTFTFNGNLVYFAAFKKHVGFYPVPTGNAAFEQELSGYKTGKGSVQFPYNKPLPLALISKMVKFWVNRNLEKAKEKKK